jgi:hypothetical protein
MRLQLLLPRVNPRAILEPTRCPYCGGRYMCLRQVVSKPLRDMVYPQVQAHRYQCLRCRRTWRIYPQGVSGAHTSQRVRGLAVMLYLLGLSYGAVSLALEALGVYMCKTRVYDAVQAAAERVPGMRRGAVFSEVRTPALGSDVTAVRCAGKWLLLGLSVDDTTGLVLTVDGLVGEDAQSLRDWLTPIVESVGAQVLISDDADAFKQVADGLALDHQVCKSHVRRNTQALIDTLTPAVAPDLDGSLAAIGVSGPQAVADLQRLDELIHTRQPDQVTELEQLFYRYAQASAPRQGQHASLAYRLRLLFLDRWTLWPRLTRYRTWRGPEGQTINGTNNCSERGIGWGIKERYRTMRGYKRPQSAVNVSRFLTWCGNYLDRGGADLAPLVP